MCRILEKSCRVAEERQWASEQRTAAVKQALDDVRDKHTAEAESLKAEIAHLRVAQVKQEEAENREEAAAFLKEK